MNAFIVKLLSKKKKMSKAETVMKAKIQGLYSFYNLKKVIEKVR